MTNFFSLIEDHIGTEVTKTRNRVCTFVFKGQTQICKNYAGAGEHFHVTKSRIEGDTNWYAYIWDADFDPHLIFLSKAHVIDVLGSGLLKTASWIDGGYNKW